jgi:NAD+ synthase
MFSKDSLKLDPEAEVEKISRAIRELLQRTRRRGLVVGLSGGIDSSVSCALSVRALGKERVFGLFMPEQDTSDDALVLGRKLAETYGIEARVETLGPALAAIGCYERQAEAIRSVEPEFGPGWKFKLALPSILEGDRLNITRLVVQTPNGETRTHRLSAATICE